MAESHFQAKVKRWLESKGCVVLKMPAGYPSIPTGFPDLLVLIPGGGYLALECKVDAKSRVQPLQRQWVGKLNDMYYARFIHESNWEEIKGELIKII